MIATGTVRLSETELKRAVLEFVERQGYSCLAAQGENVKIERHVARMPPPGGHTGGMSDGYDIETYSATVYVETKKENP